MKRLLLAVLVCMMMVGTAHAKKKVTIGFTFHSAQLPFQNILKDDFVKAAEEQGIEVKVIDPLIDIYRQNAAIDNFITLGVDAIVCSPLDYEGSVPGVLAANSAGIPYVAVNVEVGGNGDFVYVGSLNYDAGLIEGEYMAKFLPENAQILYLRGTEGMEHTIARRKGVQDALLEKRPDVKLLAEQSAKYERAEGMRVMEDWIQAYPKIDGVIAANDEMALGALEALKGAGIEGVMIAGIDGTQEARERVKDGTFAITVLQDAHGQAVAALQAAIDLIDGKKVEKRVIIPFRPITKENVDEYLK
ncbi:MAG: sugar ABC transporter substrate-binding protein [Desulfopila sp.]